MAAPSSAASGGRDRGRLIGLEAQRAALVTCGGEKSKRE
jgi:hypothetical protein